MGEVKSRSGGLSARSRTALILVNGVDSLAALRAKIGPDADALVEALAAQGHVALLAPPVATQVLPTLSRSRRDQPIRIWSAACSTGQEVYSLAMAAAASETLDAGTRFEFFGSDLSERCLEKAQSGLYTQFEVQRGLPIRLLVQHFGNQDDTWEISPRIRQSVRWKRINLLSDLSALGRFDVILLRHVLSGLEPSLHGRIVESLASLLAPDGVLVLSPDDHLPNSAGDLVEATEQAGVFVRGQARAVAAA